MNLHDIPKEVPPIRLFWAGQDYICTYDSEDHLRGLSSRDSPSSHHECARAYFVPSHIEAVYYCECFRDTCSASRVRNFHYFISTPSDTYICDLCRDNNHPAQGEYNV